MVSRNTTTPSLPSIPSLPMPSLPRLASPSTSEQDAVAPPARQNPAVQVRSDGHVVVHEISQSPNDGWYEHPEPTTPSTNQPAKPGPRNGLTVAAIAPLRHQIAAAAA